MSFGNCGKPAGNADREGWKREYCDSRDAITTQRVHQGGQGPGVRGWGSLTPPRSYNTIQSTHDPHELPKCAPARCPIFAPFQSNLWLRSEQIVPFCPLYEGSGRAMNIWCHYSIFSARGSDLVITIMRVVAVIEVVRPGYHSRPN